MTRAVDVTLRVLDGDADQMRALQQVLDDAPRYAQLITGAPPGPGDAQSVCTMLPEGKSYDDKFVLGIFSGSGMVGCIDLVRGYPDPVTTYVGLLLIGQAHEDRGYGKAAVARLLDVVQDWGTCVRLRLGIVRGNERAVRFWSAAGFVPTGEVKPYRYGPIVSETTIYERLLDVDRP